MADRDDVRRIASRLPDTTFDDAPPGEQFGASVTAGGKQKGIAWSWRERVHPKRPKVVNVDVLAVRVVNVGEKETLIAADPAVYFTEPHYDGFPAVLVRLAAIDPDELEELLIDAWRCLAPKALVRRYDDAHAGE